MTKTMSAPVPPVPGGQSGTRIENRPPTRRGRAALAVLAVALLGIGWPRAAEANGILRNGVGARAMALGGADIAWAEDALGPLAANPAGLGWLERPTLDLGVTAVRVSGDFTNVADDDGEISGRVGLMPDAAAGGRIPATPVSVGLGLVTDAALAGHWRYVDAPGGAGGVSYGRQAHESSIVVARLALGVGVDLGPYVALGATVGLVYNDNSLHAPYIFQSQPGLAGLKTLLDLETSGWGWNGTVGVLVRPHETLQLGLGYRSETTIDSEGRARGDAAAQLAALGVAIPTGFRYDAEVRTKFPQVVSGGASWRAHPRWRFVGQVEWINWSDAFDELPITLTNGSNAALNGIVGSSTLRDTVPLGWRDRFVYRAGVEWTVTEPLRVRLGYAYGKSPVPDRTLTPLTGAIMEHTITAGVGYRIGPVQLDFAYQYDLPVTRRVADSDLRSGEYDQSEIEVSLHWVAVTASIRF